MRNYTLALLALLLAVGPAPALADDIPIARSQCTRNLNYDWHPPMPDPCDFHTLPDLPISRKFIDWLHVFASGDETGLTRFIETAFVPGAVSAAEHIERRAATGGYEFQQLQEIGDDRIDVVLEEYGTGTHIRASMEIEADGENRISLLRFDACPPETLACLH